MKMKFKKDKYLVLFFVFLGSTLVFLLGCLLLLWSCEKAQQKELQKSIESYSIANEVRQSSEGLTKMVRLYVLTGNKDYVKMYNEILSIRNGTSPRPLDYGEIYWDFVIDINKRPRPYGPAVSLKNLMINHGFSTKELDLLEESQSRSDTLVQMEQEAIHAMQGLYNNGAGVYSIKGEPNPNLARRLVSDNQYREQKAKIMEPLLAFSKAVEQRTAEQTKALSDRALNIIIWSVCFTVFAVVMMLVCLFKSIKSLTEMVETNQNLLLNVLPTGIAERFKKGEESIVDEYNASVLFVRISHFGETLSADTMSAVFDALDDLARQYEVEKIQAVGDSQVIVSGIPVMKPDHQILLADFALALKTRIETFNRENRIDLHIRIGMASGTVIAGVVGHKRFVYDLWGDVVTLACALESSGVIGEIQISETTAQELDREFEVEERGVVELSELGPVKTYFLRKRRIEKKSLI